MATGSFITPTGGSSGGSALIPYAAYLDTVSGNDSTAVLGNSTKPYLTMTALIAALPAIYDFTWTIYITGSTVDISMPVMPVRNLIFNADTRYIYNFNFNTTRPSTNFIFEAVTIPAIYTFLNENINLKSNSASLRSLSFVNGTSHVYFRGTINIIDWSNAGDSNVSMCLTNSNLVINEYIKRTAGSCLQINTPEYMRIKKLTYIGFYSGIFQGTCTVWSTLIIDLISCSTAGDIDLISGNGTVLLNIELRDIQINGALSTYTSTSRLTLNNLTCSATTTFLDFRECLFITGNVVSDIAMRLARVNNKTLQNLEAKITGNANFWGSTMTIDNCRLTVTDYLAKNAAGVLAKPVIFKGNNIIKQISKTTSLINSDNSTNPYSIDVSGTLNIEPNTTLINQFGTINYLNDATPSYRGKSLALQSQTFLT